MTPLTIGMACPAIGMICPERNRIQSAIGMTLPVRDMLESSPLTALRGVGKKGEAIFGQASIYTVGDLVRYYPRSYDTFTAPVRADSLSLSDDGRTVSVEGKIEKPLNVITLKTVKITSGKIFSGGAFIGVKWYNMPYLRGRVRPLSTYIFRGIVRANGRSLILQMPKVYTCEEYMLLIKSMQPIYRLVKGLTESFIRRTLREAFYGRDPLDLSEDLYPEWMLAKYGLCSRREAFIQVHFPRGEDSLRMARKRLVFDEFFFFILMAKRLRVLRVTHGDGIALPPVPCIEKVIESLPYKLTNSQKKVWREVSGDMASSRTMARLIEGDVGCGKTIIAFLSLIQASGNRRQAAMMAPTDILARQHFEAFIRMCENARIPSAAVLLTGSLSAPEKKKVLSQIKSGEALVVIGTHALFQEKVEYRDLALVITDEQHRFGVRQKELFREKGSSAHMIVMSATPIPRTLASILYGELDISIIDQMPPCHLPARNAVVSKKWRPNAYKFIAGQVRDGHQAYVICPMVEESEEISAEDVIDYAISLDKELKKYLPSVRVAYLHGRMDQSEKIAVMERFSNNEINVLVSTTVVEVGVNVPNATVMMVENSERFGLAQLHQLRGRIERGKCPSYCIFMYGQDNETVRRRLNILASSDNGFEIAQKDLELRGPGDISGVRQSGYFSFTLANIYADADVMRNAREAVDDVLLSDPELRNPDHRAIALRIGEMDRARWSSRMSSR